MSQHQGTLSAVRFSLNPYYWLWLSLFKACHQETMQRIIHCHWSGRFNPKNRQPRQINLIWVYQHPASTCSKNALRIWRNVLFSDKCTFTTMGAPPLGTPLGTPLRHCLPPGAAVNYRRNRWQLKMRRSYTWRCVCIPQTTYLTEGFLAQKCVFSLPNSLVRIAAPCSVDL